MWSNLVTTIGVCCVLFAIAMLTNIWWTVLVLGLILIVAGFALWQTPLDPPAADRLRDVARDVARDAVRSARSEG